MSVKCYPEGWGRGASGILVTADANSPFLDLKLTTLDCSVVRKFQVDFFFFWCGKM